MAGAPSLCQVLAVGVRDGEVLGEGLPGSAAGRERRIRGERGGYYTVYRR